MNNLDSKLIKHVDSLIERYSSLLNCKEDIINAYLLLEECFSNSHKLLVAGNGGSAADAEHIVSELMKSFEKKRPINNELKKQLIIEDKIFGEKLSNELENCLPAISLTEHPALNTAFANEVNADLIFAQQLNGYGNKGDVFLAISTSGISENIMYAAVLAKAKGLKVIVLTGNKETKLSELANVIIKAPETRTCFVQELHLPIYHTLCLMLEDKFFN